MADNPHLPPVRWTGAWIDRVIVPLLTGRWLTRTLGIFVNNTALCAMMVAAGALPGGSWASITLVGVAMGFAVRHLNRTPTAPTEPPAPPPRLDRLTVAGLALNLLEPPALALCVGLSVGQIASAPHFSAGLAWMLYARCVVPLLLVAAVGESTWIGRVRPFQTKPGV